MLLYIIDFIQLQFTTFLNIKFLLLKITSKVWSFSLDLYQCLCCMLLKNILGNECLFKEYLCQVLILVLIYNYACFPYPHYPSNTLLIPYNSSPLSYHYPTNALPLPYHYPIIILPVLDNYFTIILPLIYDYSTITLALP